MIVSESASTLDELFRATVECFPDNVLVHHLGRNWTYREIGAKAASLAGWLGESGLQEGQRVGLLLPNSAEYVACYFGILMAGGVVVALNPSTTARELSHTLAHCQPAAVITCAKAEEHLDAIAGELGSVRLVVRAKAGGSKPPAIGRTVGSLGDILARTSYVGRNKVAEIAAGTAQLTESERAFCHQTNACPATEVPAVVSVARSGLPAPADEPRRNADGSRIAQIIYTSGTTGQPKGVALSHRNLLANCRSIVQYLELGVRDSVLVVLPFYYAYGNSLLLTHAAVGGRLILASDTVYWNRVLDLMQQQQATGMAGVPFTFAMLLHKSTFAERTFPHLRYLTCGGGPLFPAVVEQLRRTVPHARIFPMYGQTEASARLSTLMPEDLDRKPGSIGKGIPGVELSVLDRQGKPVAVGEVGEIVARGENVMVGYFNDPESTRRTVRGDGLHTGDMARVDEEGYLYVVGRRSDMIKSNAYRIHPQEIEEAIAEMEGIAEAAVVGLPDDLLGEVPVAFVVASDGGAGPSEEAILDHCRRLLPRHKQVRRALLVDTLPRTSSGKVKRAELRERLAGQTAAPPSPAATS